MPVVKIVNMSGAAVGELTLNDKIFGADVNGAVLHAAVRTYLMNQRQGTQSTLTRSEVSGGGRKPWRQKGTGRARQGSTRSPQWTHGGIALGPKPRDYRIAMNKKTRRVALFSALSDKVDVTGITKGRGYTGAIKRWNLHLLGKTHGIGPIHRQSGSMGVIDPARIFKNKKMAGQYGNEQVTVLNLKVVKIDAERNLIAIKGAIPGAKDGIVFIRDSVKA